MLHYLRAKPYKIAFSTSGLCENTYGCSWIQFPDVFVRI